MLIFGIILIAVGIGLVFYKKKLEDKLLNIKYFDRTDIQSVVENCQSVADELGAGNYSKMVKISAKAGLDEPLIGEFSNATCVYYEVSATHRYKKLVESEDSDGKRRTNWVNGSDAIGSAKVGGEFWVQDNSGSVDIDIDGAELTMEQSVSDFKSSRGIVDFSFGTYSPTNNSRFRSTGYAVYESHIKEGAELFIVGELHDREGIPMIGKPQEKDNPFIVSVDSEATVIKKLTRKTKMVFYGGVAAAVIGFFLTIGSFFA